MFLFVILVVFGLLCGFIASSKGRSFFGWFIYGFFLGLIALIHVIFIKSNGRKCPDCTSRVDEKAKVCKYCKHTFTKTEIKTYNEEKEKQKKRNRITLIVLGCIFFSVFLLAKIIFLSTTRDIVKNISTQKNVPTQMLQIPYQVESQNGLFFIIIDRKYVNTEDLTALGKELHDGYIDTSFERISLYDDREAVNLRDVVIHDEGTAQQNAFYDLHYIAQYNKNDATSYNQFAIYQTGSGKQVNEVINY